VPPAGATGGVTPPSSGLPMPPTPPPGPAAPLGSPHSPSDPPAPQPAAPASSAPEATPETVSGDRATVASPGSAAPAEVVLSDGRRVAVDRPLVIGRAPAAPATQPDARLVVVSDTSVAESHVMVGVSADRVWVRDLDSAGGIVVEGREGPSIQPGDQVVLPFGGRVVLGDETSFTVEQGSDDAP
jgi:FHA domain